MVYVVECPKCDTGKVTVAVTENGNTNGFPRLVVSQFNRTCKCRLDESHARKIKLLAVEAWENDIEHMLNSVVSR
jgi:hypothetical protein